MTHGYDAAGQNVVILNISKHRKDSKKALMLRKWIAFCYEAHVSENGLGRREVDGRDGVVL